MNIQELYAIIYDRMVNPVEGSYTVRLLAKGEDEIVKKIGEEAIEIILAAKAQGDQRLIEEIADLTYHVLLLMAFKGLKPEDIQAELTRRHR